ncbi:MAG: GYF domain-containing protein [Hyphomicrobiaceae bacterium]
MQRTAPHARCGRLPARGVATRHQKSATKNPPRENLPAASDTDLQQRPSEIAGHAATPSKRFHRALAFWRCGGVGAVASYDFQGQGLHRPASGRESNWLIERGGTRIGPFSIVQLALAAKTGLLEPHDKIWQPGLARWYAAGEVPGLLMSAPQPPLPPMPRLPAPEPRPAIALHRDAATPAPNSTRPPAQPATAPRFPLPALPTLHHAPGLGLPPLPTITPAAPELAAMLAEAVSPTTVAMPAGTTTEWIAEGIARKIIVILELQNIRTLDDLASDEKLKSLAALVVDSLPMAVRIPVCKTIGRGFVEGRIVDLLRALRDKLDPRTRTADLSEAIVSYAPRIAQAIDKHMHSAKSSARETLVGAWETTVDSLRRLGRSQARITERTA